MYSIGLFSKINKITTKTLRYYDEIGLLQPEYVDPKTNYRYYTSNQLLELHQIFILKQMGLPLCDIGQILNNPTAILSYLKSKEAKVKKDIKAEKRKLLQIQNFYMILKGEYKNMYTPIIKELPEVNVASMRRVVPDYNAFFNIIPNEMANEMRRLDCKCAVPEYCFNIYHDGEYKAKNIDVEMCEAIVELKKDSDILKFKKMPKVDNAVCVLHKGSYELLRDAYSFIFKWIKDNNYEIAGNPRESYIDGIWNKETEEEWLTEIQVPINLK